MVPEKQPGVKEAVKGVLPNLTKDPLAFLKGVFEIFTGVVSGAAVSDMPKRGCLVAKMI